CSSDLDLKDEYRILEQDVLERLRRVLVGQKVNGGAGQKRGTELTDEILDSLKGEKWFELRLADEEVAGQLERAHQYLDGYLKEQEERFNDKKGKITDGDDLPHGVLKVVKVYLAIKRSEEHTSELQSRFDLVCR